MVENNVMSSKEAEENIIVSILTNEDNQKYIDKIERDDFYYPANRKIFDFIKELKDKEEAIDILTVKELGVSKKYDGLKILEILSEMADGLIYSGNIEKYIKILKNLSMKRKIYNLSKTICEEIATEDINKDEIELKNEAVQRFLDLQIGQNQKNKRND